MDWDSIRSKVTVLLQDLIRFDTTNPPGNETPCLEYMAGVLCRAGIETTDLRAVMAQATRDGMHSQSAVPKEALEGICNHLVSEHARLPLEFMQPVADKPNPLE